MASMQPDFTLSLRSWPSGQNDPASALPAFFQRMVVERGGLRNVTEESLRQEIADEEAAATAGQVHGAREEPAVEEPDRLKELMAAREEMLDHIHQAHIEALLALDVVSLLLTKTSPNDASVTMNPELRGIVPLGSLGADKLSVPRYTEAQKLDNKRVAMGWKIQSLNKTVDSVLASATRLESEIAKETRYWEQILAVDDAGWSLCRLPHEKHTLGVRFGFAESAPAFKNRSLAALRRNPDGTMYLDQGITSTKPLALRVRIHTNSTETGSSTLPLPLADDAPIQSTILQARNAIFDEELWQEINLESRYIGMHGVRAYNETVVCPLTPTKNIVLDLIMPGDSCVKPEQPDDNLADGICLSLHLLLSCAHRRKHRERTQIPRPLSAQDWNQQQKDTYSLLRPLITRKNHQIAIASAHQLFKSLCAVLASAKVTPESTYNMKSSPPPAALISGLSVTEATMMSLTDHLESIFSFKATESTSLSVTLRTGIYSRCCTDYLISLSPDSPLNITFKPPPVRHRWHQVEEYVLHATSCALASSFSRPVDQKGDGVTWEETSLANTLRMADADKIVGRGKELSFQAETENNTVKLRVTWKYTNSVFGFESNVIDAKDFKMGEGSYEWKINGDVTNSLGWEQGEGEVIRSLRDVVEEAGRS